MNLVDTNKLVPYYISYILNYLKLPIMSLVLAADAFLPGELVRNVTHLF